MLKCWCGTIILTEQCRNNDRLAQWLRTKAVSLRVVQYTHAGPRGRGRAGRMCEGRTDGDEFGGSHGDRAVGPRGGNAERPWWTKVNLRAPRKQRARLDTRPGGGHLLNHLYDLHILAQRHSVAGPSQSATRRQTQPPAPMSPQYRRCARRPSSSAYTLAGGEQRAVLSCPHRPDPIQVRESGSRTVPAVPHSELNGTAMYR